MASKKQNSSKTAKNAGSKSAKNAGSKSGKNASRKGRGVQVAQPKPWGLILTFSGVGVVALGLIAVAAFVVWDRSKPPEGVTNFYGDYGSYEVVKAAIDDGEITAEDLDHPWVVQQEHLDADEDTSNDQPTYEISPPAGGNHLSQWQTCTGAVYADPIADGNAVHSLEHGAVWLTYDPELVDEGQVSELASKIEGRDFSLMSPYPGQGVAVSLQAWGVQLQTDDPADPEIDQFLNYYIQNGDNLAEMGASCTGGVSTTTATTSGGETEMTEEEASALLEQMESSAPAE
ncbi:DUF3105 domain-containing protein [Glycomyces arizonensis]|uniref:DUF3105 domain-containing protein n=1 Tax=Glycomyces arizonensis TaxID=256035 RepID=UPI00040C8E19|nr:DUF3105 domain-containing protein [Glycomyces arizonensis]